MVCNQLCSAAFFVQVISQFATISSSTGEATYPEPAATLVRALGMANLDILGFGACFGVDRTFVFSLGIIVDLFN